VSVRTTICCSALVLLALAKGPEGPPSLVPLRAIWTLALNTHLVEAPAYDATRGYFAVEGDRLAAYELSTGKQLWLVTATPKLALAAADDLVFVAEEKTVTALHAADGTQAWQTPIEQPFTISPAVEHGHFIGVTKGGSVVALRSSDGHVEWQHDLGASARAPVTVTADRVYASVANQNLVALALDSGEPIWTRHLGGAPSQLLALDQRLFVGSTDNFMYCLFTKDGRIDWRYRVGGDGLGAPAADADRIYFVSMDNVLRSMSQVTGGQFWMKPLPFRPTGGPLISGSTVTVAGRAAAIKTFNAKDGAPLTDVPTGDEVVGSPALLYDRVNNLPLFVFVTRHIVRGDTVTLNTRSLDPAAAPFVPLASTATPPPMQAKPR